ncbi:MAG TPA: YkgJ family cysteine cluster protein [Polyangiales bacterium]
MPDEYRALVDKVTAFTAAACERRAADIACTAGCSSCCEVWLTVSPVEAAQLRAGLAALSPQARAQLGERGRHEQAREAEGAANARCAMLEPDGRCAVYAHRPLVCRTQGHALRYPAGFVPEAAVRARTSSGDVTYCPLNFSGAAPMAEDVLDAERVDQILAVVGQRFALAHSHEPGARFALSALAAESAG